MKKQIKLGLLLISVLIAALPNVHAQNSNSNYGGLGIEWKIDENSGLPIVTEIIKGMPAEQLHIQPNDFITKIDNQATQNLPIEDLNNRLKGPVGSVCYIVVSRDNVEYPVSFTRAKFYPDWAPGAVDNYYHIVASETFNHWHAQPGYLFVTPVRVGDLRTRWQEGLKHPYYNVIASNIEGKFQPIPGYFYVNKNPGDFNTRWEDGVIHPQYKVVSTKTEGVWVPMPGYKFTSNVGLDVAWTPGIHYANLKIISGRQESQWLSYPGYVFVDARKSLSVTWKAGIPKPGDPTQVSGTTEGTWVDADMYASPNTVYVYTAIAEAGVAAVLNYLIGDNMLSDYLYKQAIATGAKATL